MAAAEGTYHFNRIHRAPNIIWNIVFIIGTIICLAPLILVIIISFTKESYITRYGYSFFPSEWSLAAYQFVLTSANLIFRAYGISIFVTVVGTVSSVLITALYAYPLARSDFKHSTLFSFIVFFTMIFGGGLVPWVMVYRHILHLNNTIWVLIIPYLITGWNVIILRTFMKSSIPEEVLESARIDGAGEFRTFFTIAVPLCKAGLATIALFAMLQYWNDWYLPLIFINEQKLYNIQYVLYQMLGSIEFIRSASTTLPPEILNSLPSESARMAIAVLAIGPIIFAYPFCQKYFVKGLTIGAVKG